MPGKIIVTDYVSLDGVVQDPVGMENSGLGDWTGPFTRGPEGDAYKNAEVFDAASVLLGRVTYDGFAAVWPHVKDEAGFADRINAMPKHVVSNTLETADWSNTTIISGDVTGKIRKLRDEADGDILIYGSAALVHSLIGAGLIDEFRLMIYPTVLGRGTRLFPDGIPVSLSFAGSRQFDDGIQLLVYRRAGAA